MLEKFAYSLIPVIYRLAFITVLLSVPNIRSHRIQLFKSAFHATSGKVAVTTITRSVGIVAPFREYHNFSQYAPIILNAGKGTTGTHFFTSATCHLGYPSIHYNLGCVPEKAIAVLDRTDHIELREDFFQVLKNHGRLRVLLTTTLNFGAKSFVEKVLKTLEDLIVEAKKNDIVLALHDNPYPMIVPQVIQAVQKVYNGKKPLIILGERDPMEWSIRRIKQHAGNEHMCKDPRPMNSTTLSGGSFDIISCIERAIDGLTPEKANEISCVDLFQDIDKMRDERGIEAVALQMKEYQDNVRDVAHFSYDMFTMENRTKIEDMVRNMQEKIGTFYPGVSVVNMNFWRNEKIDDR